MNLEATRLNIADDLCNAFRYLRADQFSTWVVPLRQRLVEIAIRNGGAENLIPIRFPERSVLSRFLHPTVSSAEELYLVLSSLYSCSLPRQLSILLNKSPFLQAKAFLSQCVRKGIVLRFLLDHRDEPFGARNNVLWRLNHFVSISFNVHTIHW